MAWRSGQSYRADLRHRVLAAVDGGGTVRGQPVRRGLAAKLLAEVNRQLDAKGLILRRGTLIDATILEAAVRPPGGDASATSHGKVNVRNIILGLSGEQICTWPGRQACCRWAWSGRAGWRPVRSSVR